MVHSLNYASHNLRGPAGSGKSEVCEGLKDKINERKSVDSCFLNLDETKPETFRDNLNDVLECQYVIGEMFSGNGHTTNPKTWINEFKNYKIFSFILKASVDTCLKRCRNDNKKRDRAYQTGDRHDKDHYKFYNCPEFVNFAKNVGIQEETINTETKSIKEVVEIIYSKIESFRV